MKNRLTLALAMGMTAADAAVFLCDLFYLYRV
jgi:hypothetical protein